MIGNRLKWALRGAFGSRGISKIPTLKLKLEVKIVADGTKNDIYLTNMTNAVILSQPSVCIGGGLHAPIHIFLGSKFMGNDNTNLKIYELVHEDRLRCRRLVEIN